ncbi:hypothetical protein NYO67_3551 [Aspergillus flavus]|nr:hypothetical protein NYO67_3551 [Aspergillus flavus]
MASSGLVPTTVQSSVLKTVPSRSPPIGRNRQAFPGWVRFKHTDRSDTLW